MTQPYLGKKIISLRKELKLTQEELAKKSKLGLRTIQRIESGKVMPRNSTIHLLLHSLGEDWHRITNKDEKKNSLKQKFTTFFLTGDVTHASLCSSIQMAWIAGIFYFLILIAEDGLEYLIFNEEEVESIWKVSYVLLKLWIFVSFGLFMRGFTVLSKVFNNTLLRIASYLMIGLMLGVVFSDIIKIIHIENKDLKVVLTISKSIMAGATSVLFGAVLLRLQDSLGVLSKYAGITEIVLGVCFILVFLSPIALALLVPATILEVVILYKGWEFIKLEMTNESQN